MIAAVFRAEFRRALPLLLACHAITLGLRTRWSGELTPRLSGVIEWGTWALAFIVLVGSIWQDSPSRPNRFLASRPMRLKSLLSAKLAALLVMVALPFVVVECCTLVLAGQLPRIILLGTLQTTVFAVVAVLAAFPFVGFWRSHAIAFSGLAVAFVAGAVLLRLFGNHPLNSQGPRWIGLDYLLTPSLLLVSLAIAGLLTSAFLLILRHRSQPALRIPIFAGCVCVALGGTLWLRVKPVVADTAEDAPLVSLKYTPLQSADGYGTLLDITPPSAPLDPSIQRLRQFTRIRINGREALRWAPYSSPYGSQRSLHLAPVQAALRQYYGDDVKLPDSYPAEDEPASALIDDVYPPVQALQIEAQVKETLYRWQVVADLPLSAGASAVHGESRWTITHATTFPDSSGGSRKSVNIQESFPTIWLGQGVGERAEPAIRDQFVLLDPSTGKMLSGTTFDYGNHTLNRRTDARRSLGENFISLHVGEDTWWEGKTPEIDWSREHRLMILRAVVVKTLFYDWRSAGPVLYPSKWLSLPYIDSLKSVRSHEPPLDSASDAAAVTRNGLGWLAEDLLLNDPGTQVLTEEEWIAFFRLEPSARRFRRMAAGFVPRPVLEQEVDRWLAVDPVSLPNPHGIPNHGLDPVLELALARGRPEAPRWLKEAITRNRKSETRHHPVLLLDSIYDAFALPPGLKSAPEVVDWFMAQDPAAFVFDPAPGKYQLR
jgi:hypothetical protein